MTFTPEAIADIARLLAFLSPVNPQAARRAAARIRAAAEALDRAPLVGRLMPDGSGRREWVIPFGGGAYVMRYRLNDDGSPVVIRIWHSRADRAGSAPDPTAPT